MSPSITCIPTAPPGANKVGDSFTAVANGDLNGDGETSEFSLSGKIDASHTLILAPTLTESKPSE